MLEPLAIRTMAKAVYTTENIGHYGLGFDFYAHFTSPIRRYADVLVHRTLFANLGEDIKREDKVLLEDKAKHISAMERKASDAERESIKYMMTVYISQFVGQEFDGVISGIIDKGMFVELAGIKVEGFVNFDSMGEVFVVEPSRYKAKSRLSGQVIKIGQAVRVKVIDADIESSRTEMVLVDNE
jgi:ribonuclease R